MKYKLGISLFLLLVSTCTPPARQQEQRIFTTLEHTVDAFRAKSEKMLESLKRKVVKEGNSAEGLEAVRRAEELHQKADDLIHWLDHQKEFLIEKTGGKDTEKNTLKNPHASIKFASDKILELETKLSNSFAITVCFSFTFFHYTSAKKKLNSAAINHFFASPSKKILSSNRTFILALSLNNFSKFITTKYTDIGIDPQAMPFLAKGTEKDKDFYQSYFKGQSLAMALSLIAERQVELLRYEHEVFKKLGAGNLSPVRVLPHVYLFTHPFYEASYGNQFKTTQQSPLSTFPIKVGHISYAILRKIIQAPGNRWFKPIACDIRDQLQVEQIINYYSYQYPEPQKKQSFSIYTEYADCPWNSHHKLLLIGIQGRKTNLKKRPPSNIVFFLNDAFGMKQFFPLVKKAFEPILQQLTTDDQVTIITRGILLPPIPGGEKEKIRKAFEDPETGNTYGLHSAYEVARQNFLPHGNNCVIVAANDDLGHLGFNEQRLKRLIIENHRKGIQLTYLNFNNFYENTAVEEAIHTTNGQYGYVDNIEGIERMLTNSFGKNSLVLAKDVQTRVEFNPLKVHSYRLIGHQNYPNFNRVPGDIYSSVSPGHQITALYEIVPNTQNKLPPQQTRSSAYYTMKSTYTKEALEGDLLTLQMDYRVPGKTKKQTLIHRVAEQYIPPAKTTDNFRFASAVAGCGMYIKEIAPITQKEFGRLTQQAKNAIGKDPGGSRKEFVKLISEIE